VAKSRFIANTVDDLTDRKRHDLRIPAKKWFFAIALAGLAIVVSALASEPVGLGFALALTGAAALALGGLSASTTATNTLSGWGAAVRFPFASFTLATGIALPIAATIWAPSISHLAPTIATFLATHRWQMAALSVACFVGFSIFAARAHSTGSAAQEKVRLQYAASLAKAFPGAGSESLWLEKAGISLRGSARDELHVNPAPPGLVLADANDNLAREMPEFCLGPSTNQQQLVLIPLTRDPAEAERREMMRRSGGLVSHTIKMPDTASRTHHFLFRLAPGISPTRAHDVEVFARTQNLELVHWLPQYGEAYCGQFTPEVAALRTRLAAALKVERTPWDLELVVTTVWDAGRQRIDAVKLVRGGALIGLGVEKRLAVLQELVLVLPGGSSGWKIHDDLGTAEVTFTFGEKAILPGLVPMQDLVPSMVQKDQWNKLTLGVNAQGEQVGFNLKSGPHSLIAGPTGSGKTVALLQLVVSALSSGHRIILIDPTKAGLDFIKVKPYCSAWAETLQEAQTVIEAVYAEGQRVKQVLKRHEEVNWADLSEEVRQAENIHPTLCVVDEFMALSLQEPVPALDRDHPLVVAANERNSARAILLANVGSIARELRFSGIFLALAMQRPDAGQLKGFGEIRSNLTSALQLNAPGKQPAIETLRMVFPGDAAAEAARVLAELDDGVSRGLAAVGADGGSVQGFRVGYAPAKEIPELLESIGVQPAVKWTLDATSTSEPEPWQRKKQATEPEVVETVETEFTFTLDDLDLEPAEPVALKPAPAPLIQPDFWA
jgi:hypothetical protein